MLKGWAWPRQRASRIACIERARQREVAGRPPGAHLLHVGLDHELPPVVPRVGHPRLCDVDGHALRGGVAQGNMGGSIHEGGGRSSGEGLWRSCERAASRQVRAAKAGGGAVEGATHQLAEVVDGQQQALRIAARGEGCQSRTQRQRPTGCEASKLVVPQASTPPATAVPPCAHSAYGMSVMTSPLLHEGLSFQSMTPCAHRADGRQHAARLARRRQARPHPRRRMRQACCD